MPDTPDPSTPPSAELFARLLADDSVLSEFLELGADSGMADWQLELGKRVLNDPGIAWGVVPAARRAGKTRAAEFIAQELIRAGVHVHLVGIRDKICTGEALCEGYTRPE